MVFIDQQMDTFFWQPVTQRIISRIEFLVNVTMLLEAI